MAERTVAKRYARALLGVAAERKVVDDVERDLYAVAEVYRAAPEVAAALADPSLTRARKVALIRRAFEGRVVPLVLEFLALLVEKRRFALVAEIAELFDDLSDELQGVIKVRVKTYLPLKPPQRERLLERLKGFTSREPILHEEVDSEILGGIVVRIGDDLIDGSVRGRMRMLKERLVLLSDEKRSNR